MATSFDHLLDVGEKIWPGDVNDLAFPFHVFFAVEVPLPGRKQHRANVGGANVIVILAHDEIEHLVFGDGKEGRNIAKREKFGRVGA